MASSSKKKLNDFITAWWTVGEQASSSYTAFNQQKKKKVTLLYNTHTESELEKPNTATAIEESVLILRLALKRKCWGFLFLCQKAPLVHQCPAGFKAVVNFKKNTILLNLIKGNKRWFAQEFLRFVCYSFYILRAKR